MAERHSDESTHEPGMALKRRGILAAAGAVMAGIVARQAALPVAAGVDGDVVLGMTNTTANATTITNTGNTQNTTLYLHCDAGTYGTALDASGTGYGVYAHLSTGINGVNHYAGVFGSTSFSSTTGVEGSATGSGGIGVFGGASAGDGIGVFGQVDNGTGVRGETRQAGIYGVYGKSGASGGVGVGGQCNGGFGVLGTVSDGYGVLGQAVTGYGLSGFSQQNHGIIGQTARPFFGGVLGVATIANTVGIYGTTNGVATAFAGYMDGNFVVANGVKSAAVPHKDGTHRLVYCMESPENWFEDFAKAKLVSGKAEVKLDADFASIVHADDYMVFLTPEGDSKGLYVTGKSAGGFSVREQQGGMSSLVFSYRVVAKRADIKAERLAKFDLPGKAKYDPKPLDLPQRPPDVLKPPSPLPPTKP